MGNRNSYFSLISKERKLYIQVIPAEEGGEQLDIKEVMAYLSERGLDNYDLKELNQAVTNPVGCQPVPVGDDIGIKISEVMRVNVSSDGMLAYARFYPPLGDGERMTESDIYSDLEYEKIVVGVDKDAVKAVAKQREYCRNYLIVKGIPPEQGEDAKIEYFFSTNTSLRPKHNEDGSVNYHDLNTISRVEEGDLLARLTKEIPGIAGKDIHGYEIKPRDVKSMRLQFANNIHLSEDQTEMYTDITGHASLVQGKVFVSGVYEVPADVDNSIGDISYPGNVNVKGNVKSGFVIRADGNIVVDGVVEGAELYAGGQIIVQRGIHGMNKGILSAKGNIIIKFIESATVKAGGYIETESIIQSIVSASTDISVKGGKGFIMGGVVRASSKIVANTIGSGMGTLTKIEVGVEPEKLEHYNVLLEKSKELLKNIDMIKPILANYSEKLSKGIAIPQDKIAFMKKQIMALQTLQSSLDSVNEEIGTLKEEFANSNKAKVRVEKVIHSGVNIKISDVSVTLKDSRKYCQFVKEGAEIKALNL